jgi:hypothetical protein
MIGPLVAGPLACGAADPEQEVRVSIPWVLESAYTCADEAASLANMKARLYASGNYGVCELTVDPVTHGASGRCPGYRPGTWIYLLLAYTRDFGDAEVREVPLAYGVQWLDLTVAALEGDEAEVAERNVAFGSDNLVTTVYGLDTWFPTTGTRDCSAERTGTEEDLAKLWAWCFIHQEREGLHGARPECDGRAEPPLLVACMDPNAACPAPL